MRVLASARDAMRSCSDAPSNKVRPMPQPLNDPRYELALASRMLANEGVLDAFGHVSLRHPTDPDRYLLPRSRSPQLIEPADVLEFTLNSEPVKPATEKLFAER